MKNENAPVWDQPSQAEGLFYRHRSVNGETQNALFHTDWEKIRTTQLIRRLHDHIDGKVELSM
jgi:hypothetical protein